MKQSVKSSNLPLLKLHTTQALVGNSNSLLQFYICVTSIIVQFHRVCSDLEIYEQGSIIFWNFNCNSKQTLTPYWNTNHAFTPVQRKERRKGKKISHENVYFTKHITIRFIKNWLWISSSSQPFLPTNYLLLSFFFP